MPETPFMGHLGSPHGPKHRSAQTDGLSGQLSRGRGRERWIPTCRGGDSMCFHNMEGWCDVGFVCVYVCVCVDGVHLLHMTAVSPEACLFAMGIFCVGWLQGPSHLFFKLNKRQRESWKLKKTHSLNSVGVCYRIKKICSVFWHKSQDSCWENHKPWMALCGDFVGV